MNVPHARAVILNEDDPEAAHFLNMITGRVQPSRLQGLFHMLEFCQDALLDALVEVLEVTVPAWLEIQLERQQVQLLTGI